MQEPCVAAADQSRPAVTPSSNCLPPLHKVLVSSTSVTATNVTCTSPSPVREAVIERLVLPKLQELASDCKTTIDDEVNVSEESSSGSTDLSELTVEGDQWTLVNTLLNTAKKGQQKRSSTFTKSESVDSGKESAQKFVITGTRMTHGQPMQDHSLFLTSRYHFLTYARTVLFIPRTTAAYLQC